MCGQTNVLACEAYDVDGYMFRREMLLPSSDHLYILESIYSSKFLAPIYQTARCHILTLKSKTRIFTSV
jgi:hypothetical protein